MCNKGFATNSEICSWLTYYKQDDWKLDDDLFSNDDMIFVNEHSNNVTVFGNEMYSWYRS